MYQIPVQSVDSFDLAWRAIDILMESQRGWARWRDSQGICCKTKRKRGNGYGGGEKGSEEMRDGKGGEEEDVMCPYIDHHQFQSLQIHVY